jgi:hypothetical protein
MPTFAKCPEAGDGCATSSCLCFDQRRSNLPPFRRLLHGDLSTWQCVALARYLTHELPVPPAYAVGYGKRVRSCLQPRDCFRTLLATGC